MARPVPLRRWLQALSPTGWGAVLVAIGAVGALACYLRWGLPL